MKAAPPDEDLQLRRDPNPAASALIGIAAVQLLAGLVGLFVYRANPDINMPELKWFIYHFQSGAFTAFDWLVTFSGVFYILLALWARRVRIPAVVMGIAVYVGLLLLQGGGVRDAVVIKIVVLSLLAFALVASFRRSLPATLSQNESR